MILRLDFLQDFAGKLLSALGSPSELSAQIAESLIMSDACGRNSNGIAILPLYAEMIAANAIDPSSTIKIEIIQKYSFDITKFFFFSTFFSPNISILNYLD